MADRIGIEILGDGRVKVTTPTIGVANHRNAEELLKLLQGMLGGGAVETKHGQGYIAQDQKRQQTQS